jgi:hypothetical protein
VVLETTRAVVYPVPNRWEAGVQFLVFLSLEVVIAMHFVPDMLLYRTEGRWLKPVAGDTAGNGAGLASPRFSGRCGIAGANFGAGC